MLHYSPNDFRTYTIHPSPMNNYLTCESYQKLLFSCFSQSHCKSWESRKSEEKMAAGAEIPADPGTASSNHSMLSRLVSCRCRDGGCEVENPSSLVSMGEWGGSNNWLCSSSMRQRARGSVLGGSVPSNRASSWWSEASATRLGMWATWTWGGGRDSAVLMGRVVTLAVTGRSLSTERGSCRSRGEISGKGKMMEDQIKIIFQQTPYYGRSWCDFDLTLLCIRRTSYLEVFINCFLKKENILQHAFLNFCEFSSPPLSIKTSNKSSMCWLTAVGILEK